ncbi:hypothetical protein PspLS_11983, partial [Pyricularia sp. CBS 133598]
IYPLTLTKTSTFRAQGFLYLLVWLPIYNLYLHPLRHIPGPKLWAVTRLFYSRSAFSGLVHKELAELHKVYGPVVRVAPNCIHVQHPEGQRDLKGHRKPGMEENEKDRHMYVIFEKSILGAPRQEHSNQRRILSHGFSAQTMVEQQPIISKYIDKLFEGLRKSSQDGTQLVELTSWFNWTTFDIIGDLAFGEPFGCLEDANYHPWVALLFDSVKFNVFGTELRNYGFLSNVAEAFVPKALVRKYAEHGEMSERQVRKRLESGADRPDFIGKMLEGGTKKEKPLPFENLAATASVIVVAGSETTATFLAGASYLVATNPEVLAKLSKEVRSTYDRDTDIDLLNTQHLSYLNAVINEALRVYPPAPSSGPRVIAPGGRTVAGQFIPENTIVDIHIWATHHDPNSFTKTESFIPERWLGDARFKNDRLDAVEAFSVGPRNCIGKNLAYAEIRMILARLIWNFDIEISPQDKDWLERNKMYIFWEKPELRVWLKPRKET